MWQKCDTYREGITLTIDLYRVNGNDNLKMVITYNLNVFEIVCIGSLLGFEINQTRYFAYTVSTQQNVQPFKIYVNPPNALIKE